MDYNKLTAKIVPKVLAIMALINNPEVAPDVRQRNQEILFETVGTDVYNKTYDMNAYDFDIEHTKGSGIGKRHFGLAKTVSGSISTGTLVTAAIATEYLTLIANKAQGDAFTNAKQSGQRPKVVRSIVGETCDWCNSLAGEYEDPPPELFLRHKNCDCTLVTSGYKSRNGLLDNYVKPKDK